MVASTQETESNPVNQESKPLNDVNLESLADAGSESEAFFEALDKDVNGGILDDTTEVTQQVASDPEQATHYAQDNGSNTWDNDENPYKKRYSDSSREAVKLREELKDLEPFVPVLEAMKNDSGLVDHVREYLVNGGAPAQSIQEKLNLGEDFMFDASDAIADPESDSAKVMNAHVDGIVQQRVGQMLKNERQNAQVMQGKARQAKEEEAFRDRMNMSEDDFKMMMSEAKGRKMTIDDIYYLVNRDKAAQNTANATKEDMITQMRNVRNMPTSASGVNSPGKVAKSADDAVFDKILTLDPDLENLFG
tara:strand:- start:18184 stop:19104 length:921 start_codon:yes stop_codon:yes gene_type:complete